MDSAPRTATQRLAEVWNSDVQHEQTPIIVQNGRVLKRDTLLIK